MNNKKYTLKFYVTQLRDGLDPIKVCKETIRGYESRSYHDCIIQKSHLNRMGNYKSGTLEIEQVSAV